MPVDQFKKIDEKRIKSEFNVPLPPSLAPQQRLHHLGGHLLSARSRQGQIQRYPRLYSHLHLDKHNEIKIENIEGFYINASPMRSVVDNQLYAIFAQAPTPKGVEHFWYAVYHFNIKRIIMLCSFEDPRRGVTPA